MAGLRTKSIYWINFCLGLVNSFAGASRRASFLPIIFNEEAFA
jgi:hypothetical protein